MGKKAKEHRKKTQARNVKIKGEQKKMQKLYQDMFSKQLTDLESKFSGETENLNVKVGDVEVPFEVVNNPIENILEQKQVEKIEISDLEK
jgi:hypothetical protein